MARPIPLVAPVTSAVWPVSRNDSSASMVSMPPLLPTGTLWRPVNQGELDAWLEAREVRAASGHPGQ